MGFRRWAFCMGLCWVITVQDPLPFLTGCAYCFQVGLVTGDLRDGTAVVLKNRVFKGYDGHYILSEKKVSCLRSHYKFVNLLST